MPLRSLAILFSLRHQRRLLRRRPWSWLIPLLGSLAILTWQIDVYRHPEGLERTWRLKASTGLYPAEFGRFFYFFYYLDLFPVATRLPVEYTPQAAERLLLEGGGALVMEQDHSYRSGELGKIFLYYPQAWLEGGPRNPSVRPFHAGLFMLALLAVWLSFCRWHSPVLGAAIVLFVGSSPFQRYETYGNENVFSWPISLTLILLALHLPFLVRRPPPRVARWAVPLVSGVLLSFAHQVRSEPAALIGSALVAYLVATGLSRRTKALMATGLVATWLLCNLGWRGYFDLHFERAYQAVQAAGGHPYPGEALRYHRFWHPVFMGLSDFDRKYGIYGWDDRTAYTYAIPVLKARYGLELTWSGGYTFDQFYDKAGVYYVKPEDLDLYEAVLKEKVLGDIARDPAWYAGILARRAWRILTVIPPARIDVAGLRFDLPLPGWLLLPALGLLLALRARTLASMLVFTLPATATALLIYAGRGTTYYATFHLLTASILAAALIEAALAAFSRRASNPSDTTAK